MAAQIRDWLGQASAVMIAENKKDMGGPTFTILAELNHKLRSNLTFCDSAEERCLGYFLSLFIDDIFNNFTADSPYNKQVVEEKNLFLGKLSGALETLSREGSDIKGSGWKALSEVVDSYFVQLAQIDKSFSQ